MEPKFQTSFIPKTPIVSSTNNSINSTPYASSTNIFSVIATAMFLVAAIVSGGLYGYKMILNNQIEKSIEEINTARAALEVEKIESLVDTNSRIVSSKQLLDKHVSVSQIIDLMQAITVKRISLSELNFKNDSELTLSIKGQSQSYNALAEQSALFRGNEFIKDHRFSNFTPAANGTITFDLSASIDPDLISYKKIIESSSTPQQ